MNLLKKVWGWLNESPSDSTGDELAYEMLALIG
jgi:hypothetical protein